MEAVGEGSTEISAVCACILVSLVLVQSSMRWGKLVTMGDPISVFLVDDHEVVRQGLRDLLEHADMTVVGEAATATEAVGRILATRPQVAVLDIQLPDGTGIDVCRSVRSQLPTTVCLMLTSFDDDEAVFAAIMAGAAGYLLKQIDGLKLVDSVAQVAQGRSLLDAKVTARVLERLRSGPLQDPRLKCLTQQERRILDLVSEGLTNRQISVRLNLAEKTLKNYVSNVLVKIGMRSRTQAAMYVAGSRRPA